jgi:alpha-aminoadipic semialdehyde synthase
LAIDNLPAEFPRDASEHFGDSLFPLLEKLVGADFNHDYAQLSLPQPVCSAVITHRGKLTPRYRHLKQALEKAGA